jgi:hypothetical protein
MSATRLRTPLILLVAGLGLSACAYDDGYGYGYGGVSVGYGNRYCDPYWDDCYSGYGRGGYAYDPWYGWYGDYYYPGIGIYVFDRSGRRHRWNDDHRRYWEGRRQRWGDRDWNDRRWERWQGYRGDRSGSGDWRDRSNRQQWNEDQGSFRREGVREGTTPRVQGQTRVRTERRVRTDGQRSGGYWRGRGRRN